MDKRRRDWCRIDDKEGLEEGCRPRRDEQHQDINSFRVTRH
jgi:hypothetical protein